MSLILVILITVLILTFVFAPLFGKRKKFVTESDDVEAYDNLISKKEVVLHNLMDAELDYKMGKLTEADYKNLQATLTLEASLVLEKLDFIEKSQNFETMVETEIKNLRKMNDKAKILEKSIEKEVKTCLVCLTENLNENKFCNSCGNSFEDKVSVKTCVNSQEENSTQAMLTKFKSSAKTCVNCQGENPLTNSFCGTCGTKL
ncbi:zinc ribbon domain-containing protein [bacterium]|nr:zinc ribbon domain-containing protein [bacterium]